MTTNTAQNTDVTKSIDTYFAFLNETDAARLRSLAQEAWTADARYVDPQHDVTGRSVIVAALEEVHAGYPGFTFRRTTGIDSHSDQARYGWELNAPDGTVIVTGIDCATVAPDGRLSFVSGFHGEPPAL